MRSSELYRANKREEVWPLIQRTVESIPEESGRLTCLDKMLASLAMTICTVSSSSREQVNGLKTLVLPVMDADLSSENKRQNTGERTLKVRDSNASTGSIDEEDLLALDALSLIPKSVQKTGDGFRALLDEATRADLEAIADHTFYKNTPYNRLQSADARYQDPQASPLVRMVFGSQHYSVIRDEFVR